MRTKLVASTVTLGLLLSVATAGAWGPGPFDNDAATDWYLGLIETGDLSLIEEALDASIVKDTSFDVSDMYEIQAACEVVLGLLAPDDFKRRNTGGPKHVDPLAGGLGPVLDLEERSSGVNFSVPGELVEWVNRHRHLDAGPLLASANAILNHVKARGPAFYDGYFRKEAAKDRWLSYVDDLHERIRRAM
jgi:hypothetical protein